ncbi:MULTISPECIES: DUF4185 domain-containing protein [unclassified Mycobacterium]|uniref:DUF4185 domain-containing protein n=1 Tax=unclassified Mycobacterium TaxID=2642494 RepID=UPI0007FB7D3E|nr:MULTISPECIES: DUF4185 domain-containing protein [unclassified Mycobacterium]OBG73066.1 hypothetical protein A5700_07230 [Mycobacterium sp. E1214]OBH26502.1 hypothetical protein A5693_03190 [Mycobacterium sp. E1319]
MSAAQHRSVARRSLLLACFIAAHGFWAATAHADPPAPVPEPVLRQLAPGQVLRLGPTAGTGTVTRDFEIGATDLCEFMEFPTQVLQICGDSFPGQGVGFGRDFAPIALRVDTSSVDDPDGVRYSGVMGVFNPLLADPTPAGDSQLPAGVVQINRRNYLMVTTTHDLIPESSRLVTAEPQRDRWQTVAGSRRPASYQGGSQTQISGYYDPIPAPDSPSGWVYIVADSFTRRDPAVLYRATPQAFTDRSQWQGWAAGAGWGKAPTPLWPDQVGEMSIKQIDGKTVLSYFNASTGNMEVRVADDPTKLGGAPVTTVVQHDEWPEPAESLPPPEDNRLAQPYGGYISPGSTLDELRIFVSQWDTRARVAAPYRVIQFAVNPFKPDD